MCHLYRLRIKTHVLNPTPCIALSRDSRLRYKRMPFGMKMSQDVFQIQMDRILEQCPGVIGIHDNVIIYGYTREDHDAN